MFSITSRSRVVFGILFGMNALIYLMNGNTILAGIWFFSSVVHFVEAYRLHCNEKEDI